MNVLITSAGAKVLLVQAFRDACATYGGRVFTADLSPLCAAGRFSDGHVAVRRSDDPEALDELLALCRQRAVRLIVPTRDGELPFFAAHKTAFADAGAAVLVPDADRLAVCQDKRRFGARLREVGLQPVPELDRPGADDFPVFVRPVTGAGGRGAGVIESPAALETARKGADLLVHPLIRAPEYTIDLLSKLDGSRSLQAVARRRSQVVAGESKVSTVVRHDELEARTLRLGEGLSLVGHSTVQAFDDPERGVLFIEVNPRFGGASNCSIQAGLDSPARILAMLAGDTTALEPRPIRRGLTMLRYSADVFVEAEA